MIEPTKLSLNLNETLNVLAIDNSTKYLSIAYGECSKYGISNYNYYHQVHTNDASNNILPQIRNLLPSETIPDYIALGIGPGGFTGVRLATSIALGLALAWNIKIIPICSLLCAIESFRSGYIWNIADMQDTQNSQNNLSNLAGRVILDARMNEIYTRTFSYNHKDSQYNLGNIELLSANHNFDIFDVQNEQNSEIILTDIENYTNNSNLFTYFTNPHALGLLSLVYNNLAFACEPQQISPNYIRNKVATTIAERKII